MLFLEVPQGSQISLHLGVDSQFLIRVAAGESGIIAS